MFYSEAIKQKTKEKLPEVTSTLDKMGETSRTMVTSMSDIVWAINPQNDDMEKLLQRIRAHAIELCSIKNIMLHIEENEKISNIKLRLEQRKNIYLVFKEALNNSLKYSGCNNIHLLLNQNNNQFIMRLSDDGKGFDTSQEFGGNGLQNMLRRSREIEGNLTIQSSIENGTIVELFVKIT